MRRWVNVSATEALYCYRVIKQTECDTPRFKPRESQPLVRGPAPVRRSFDTRSQFYWFTSSNILVVALHVFHWKIMCQCFKTTEESLKDVLFWLILSQQWRYYYQSNEGWGPLFGQSFKLLKSWWSSMAHMEHIYKQYSQSLCSHEYCTHSSCSWQLLCNLEDNPTAGHRSPDLQILEVQL